MSTPHVTGHIVTPVLTPPMPSRKRKSAFRIAEAGATQGHAYVVVGSAIGSTSSSPPSRGSNMVNRLT
jgi:hypothetical protein